MWRPFENGRYGRRRAILCWKLTRLWASTLRSEIHRIFLSPRTVDPLYLVPRATFQAISNSPNEKRKVFLYTFESRNSEKGSPDCLIKSVCWTFPHFSYILFEQNERMESEKKSFPTPEKWEMFSKLTKVLTTSYHISVWAHIEWSWAHTQHLLHWLMQSVLK